MVKTQISHPTSSPLISGFDWHTPLFFFSLSPPRLFLMLLAVPVSLCDNREPATLSMFAAASLNPLSLFSPSLSPPPLSLSLSVTGWRATTPYFHKCSKSTKTSCSATYHEGRVVPWSCWKPAERLGDWERDPRVVLFFFSFFLSSQMPLFSLFCFGVCGRRFFAETNFLLLFFRHDGEKKKNLYRLIMLKACILTQDIDKHTYTQITNQTYTFKDATLQEV